MQLETGRLVLRRHFMRDDLLSRVWVGRVAADDDHGLWMWVAAGSPYLDLVAADGRTFREVPFAQWPATPKAMADLTWRGSDVLMLHPHGAPYSVWFRFGDKGFLSWYVNLEDPVSRWDDGALAGVDTIDHDLDVVVAADRSWRWKDEEEFLEHLAHPQVYWVEDEGAVRAAGAAVVELIEAGTFPFDGTRTDYRPERSWSVPAAMPAGWDRPHEPATPRTGDASPIRGTHA